MLTPVSESARALRKSVLHPRNAFFCRSAFSSANGVAPRAALLHRFQVFSCGGESQRDMQRNTGNMLPQPNGTQPLPIVAAFWGDQSAVHRSSFDVVRAACRRSCFCPSVALLIRRTRSNSQRRLRSIRTLCWRRSLPLRRSPINCRMPHVGRMRIAISKARHWRRQCLRSILAGTQPYRRCCRSLWSST